MRALFSMMIHGETDSFLARIRHGIIFPFPLSLNVLRYISEKQIYVKECKSGWGDNGGQLRYLPGLDIHIEAESQFFRTLENELCHSNILDCQSH